MFIGQNHNHHNPDDLNDLYQTNVDGYLKENFSQRDLDSPLKSQEAKTPGIDLNHLLKNNTSKIHYGNSKVSDN